MKAVILGFLWGLLMWLNVAVLCYLCWFIFAVGATILALTLYDRKNDGGIYSDIQKGIGGMLMSRHNNPPGTLGGSLVESLFATVGLLACAIVSPFSVRARNRLNQARGHDLEPELSLVDRLERVNAWILESVLAPLSPQAREIHRKLTEG